MTSSTQIKVKPLQAIIPCPRCINGQILALNGWVCFQCGYELKKGASEVPNTVGGTKPLQDRFLFGEAESIICPKCGKDVYLNVKVEPKVIRVHKDPATEGAYPRPWCDMSGEAIP